MRKEAKSELEQYAENGALGTPEIKREEKRIFLGEFKERVIMTIDIDEILDESKNNQVEEKAKASNVDKIIVNDKIKNDIRIDYMKIAKEHKKDFKLVQSDSHIAVVLASKEANDIEHVKL